MRVFTCTNFEGTWPVGTAAVVVAEDESEAAKTLGLELAQTGCGTHWQDLVMTEVDLTEQRAYVLRDGEY